jgi:PH (Pleckstrin Homology) domain-containing protein
VPEIWVGLDAGARRRNWWWTAVLTVIFAGMAAAAYASDRGETGFPAAEPAIGAGWLCAVFYMVNRGYGRALLAPGGMQFRTFLSRRSIPWSDITGIERKPHYTRGGAWWEVRVERVDGRPLWIPGIFTARR